MSCRGPFIHVSCPSDPARLTLVPGGGRRYFLPMWGAIHVWLQQNRCSITRDTKMLRRFLRSKIHRVRVTQTDLEYVGSVTIDRDLMDAAGIAVNEQVDIYNITTGSRFTTYAIEGERGSGVIGVNGAAAHLANVGDFVIVVAYCDLYEEEIAKHEPRIVLVDEQNCPK